MSWSTQNIYDYVVNHLRTGNKVHGTYKDDSDGLPCYCAKGCLIEIEELKLNTPQNGGHSDNPFNSWIHVGYIPKTLTEEIMYLLDDLEWVWERNTNLYASVNHTNLKMHPRSEVRDRNLQLLQKTDEECFQLIARRYCLTYKPVDMKLPDVFISVSATSGRMAHETSNITEIK